MAAGAVNGPVPTSAVPGQRVLALLDKAVEFQSPLVHKNIARARQRSSDATPAQVIRTLERMYVSALTGTGAAVGGAAAAPEVGTGVALALSAGEAFSSLELSALFALSIAEVHGVRLDEVERRRTLVMGVLLGGSGSATIAKVAERTGQHWGRQVVASVPVATLRQINKILQKNFITKYGTKQGIIVLGRAAPFGIGAVIGWRRQRSCRHGDRQGRSLRIRPTAGGVATPDLRHHSCPRTRPASPPELQLAAALHILERADPRWTVRPRGFEMASTDVPRVTHGEFVCGRRWRAGSAYVGSAVAFEERPPDRGGLALAHRVSNSGPHRG